MALTAADFDLQSIDPNDDEKREQAHAMESIIENLQETVLLDRTIDLDEKDPFADALWYVRTEVDGSGGLSRKSRDFLLSKQGKPVLESGARRIVGSYFQRLSKK